MIILESIISRIIQIKHISLQKIINKKLITINNKEKIGSGRQPFHTKGYRNSQK